MTIYAVETKTTISRPFFTKAEAMKYRDEFHRDDDASICMFLSHEEYKSRLQDMRNGVVRSPRGGSPRKVGSRRIIVENYGR